MSNPYSEMARAFCAREEDGGRLRFGVVTGTEPLAVEVGGLPVSGAALWVSEALTPVEREAEIYLPDAEIGEPNAEIRVKAPLSAGDRVLLYSDGDQVFYIICKVVSAS